jgi:transposase
MSKSPRLRQPDRSKTIPAVVIDELVPADDPVRAIWAYVTTLDLDPFLKSIKAVEGRPGRNATTPLLLVALWMLATLEGVGSARWLAKLCKKDNSYRWLCGGVTVNYHMLSDFRKDCGAELEALLTEHVAILIHAELVQLKRVAQDGVRVRANAGASSFHKSETLEEHQRDVRQQLEVLKKQPDEDLGAAERRSKSAKQRHLEEKSERLKMAQEAAAELAAKREERLRQNPGEAAKETAEDAEKKAPRGSSTDPECRRMKMADGGYRPAYNVQAMTTTEEKIILKVDVTNQGTDSGLLVPMVDNVEETYGKKVEEATVDGGYVSKEDVEAAEARGTKVYMPLKNAKKDLAAGKNPYLPKRNDKAGMKALRARMGTEEAKEIYKERASTAEWVNAGMRNRGLYQFLVRGLKSVLSVVLIQALVHNLFQTIRLCAKKCPQRRWTDVLREGASKLDKNKTNSL